MRKALLFFVSSVLLLACDVGTKGPDRDNVTGGSGGTGGTGVAGTGAGGTGTGGTGTGATDPGTVVTVTEPAARTEARAGLDLDLDGVRGLGATTIRERFPTSFDPAPTYTPSAIAGLDVIQASPLALTPTEVDALAAKGFVITPRNFPTFAYGYSTIYMADLPVYISADSILESVHRSYDRVLETLEQQKLISELSFLLTGMRSRLEGGVGSELGPAAQADADVYLAIAASLLEGTTAAPVAGGSAELVSGLVQSANDASGVADVVLFGVKRENEDFSQFKPRGHYTDSDALSRYFRAMMWLGRIDFRLFETQEDGTQIFRRRQLDGMLLLNALVDDALRQNFERIDGVVRTFVGEPDYMELRDVAPLLEDVGVSSLDEAAGVSDQTWAQAIFDGGYGLQRISSHVMVNGATGTLPLSLSFAFLGQRYVIDSHVFSNVVYDRAGGGNVHRLMPNPLDAAFAVLANDQAAELLAPELEEYAYAPDLAAMRVLADHHPPEFWNGNLYNLWLGALRELGPAAIAESSDFAALPATFRSEAWGRRLLNTELASWAELRHDTILYAKQSYTGGAICEFPDGYVDPYPEFYAKLVAYAERGRDTVAPLVEGTSLEANVSAYFDNLAMVAGRLRDMATHQRTGAPYTQEMLDFLNDAVVVQPGCGEPYFAEGWYKQLFFYSGDGIEWAPTIADVHTQPMDLGGNLVGRVLHVGTGDARQMVVVADTCSGPRAYVGLASSYYERITEDFERLDDPTWETLVRSEPAVPWFADLVTP